MQFRTGTKRTETAREDARWSLEIENISTSTQNSNLLTNWRWIRGTISHRVNFRKCCIANAKWMAFANWKVAIFYVVNGAALELQFARKSYGSVFTLRFWAPENTEKNREGCVHTSILTICVCFSNCCFGIFMSRSFSFNRSIWQVNPGCQMTACRKEASGNTLHHHTSTTTSTYSLTKLVINTTVIGRRRGEDDIVWSLGFGLVRAELCAREASSFCDFWKMTLTFHLIETGSVRVSVRPGSKC